MSPTVAPLVIISIIAPISAIDVVYFHIYKFRLYSHRGSRLETLTHLVRGLLFTAIVFLLTRYEPHGAWFWLLVGLGAVDFLNNVIDVSLEPRSRAPLGGIPPLEYLVHILGATGSGFIAGAWVFGGWSLGALPTELASPGNAPAWLTMNGHVMYIVGSVLLVGEATLLLRAMLRERSQTFAAV